MKLCVLILRGLGAGYIGPYGNRWVDTPSLNALASQATVFETHLSAHPDDETCRRVWRSGRHRFPGVEPSPEVSEVDLLAILRQGGVNTQLLFDASVALPEAFRVGWDRTLESKGLQATITAGVSALGELSRSTTPALLWIELASLYPPWTVKEEFITPYFSESSTAEDEDAGDEESTQLVEPLAPLFDPPLGPIDPEDDLLLEQIHTTYAAVISQLDSALADLLDGLPDDVTLLLTSDHGQALGEHGVVGPCRPWLFREVVQLPLILRCPSRAVRRRAAGLTLSVDLAPTIADLFAVPFPACHGHSVLPLAGLTPVGWREYACLGLRQGDEVEWGMWTADWALRQPQREGASPCLYVRPDDRAEVNDILQHQADEVDALIRTLRAYITASQQPGSFTPPPLTTTEAEEAEEEKPA